MALTHKIAPLMARLRGRAPLCPWRSVLLNLHPGTWRARPPAFDLQIIETIGERHLLRFAGKHDFWFPSSMLPTAELWSEYLVTTWDHPCNGHYYLRNGVDVAPGDLVLDCGSCEGFFARQALESGAERVLCIEPNREMVECLRATFAAEIAAGRVEVIEVALAAFAGEANFHIAPGEAFSGAFSEEGNNRVIVATLDQIAAKYGQPSMIKMDLEGHEYEALRGGESTLRDGHPKLAITTYHQPWDFAVVHGLLRGLGYPTIRFSSATMRGGGTPRAVMLHATYPPKR